MTVWHIWDTRGFLMEPDPMPTLVHNAVPLVTATTEEIETLAAVLPDLLQERRLRPALDALPVFDMSALSDPHHIERAFQIYSFFASAYVHATGEPTAKRIPAGVAVPLVQLAQRVQRPPILAYASYTLANWRRLPPAGSIKADRLNLIQRFISKKDAAWFTLIHVEIEAEAAPALAQIAPMIAAAHQNDADTLMHSLQIIAQSLQTMMATFQRMPEHCHPDVYYHEVRPYIFGFEDVVYEGVVQYGGKPQTLRGETGAQSSIIPALVKALGLQHEQNSLTEHLRIMRAYMPVAHRQFIEEVDGKRVRGYVQANRTHAALTMAYNECLQHLLEFRQMHWRFANAYANRSANPQGTGGTDFMHWLQQLIDETASHKI